MFLENNFIEFSETSISVNCNNVTNDKTVDLHEFLIDCTTNSKLLLVSLVITYVGCLGFIFYSRYNIRFETDEEIELYYKVLEDILERCYVFNNFCYSPYNSVFSYAPNGNLVIDKSLLIDIHDNLLRKRRLIKIPFDQKMAFEREITYRNYVPVVYSYPLYFSIPLVLCASIIYFYESYLVLNVGV